MNAAVDIHGPIKVATEGRVGVIELHRPEVFNCLTRRMLSEIRSALESFEQTPIRAVVISAAGKNFCTGASLDEVEIARADPSNLRDFLAHGHAVMDRIEQSPLPVIAAVQGLCLAGGIELALACDVVIAAEDAEFGDQHAAFGLIPGWGGSQRLPHSIGLQRALDLMFSTRRIDASTALLWGLVSRLSDPTELRADAIRYAETISSRNAEGVAAMKRLARRSFDQELSVGLQREREEAFPILRGANVDEGLKAFKERRTPKFA